MMAHLVMKQEIDWRGVSSQSPEKLSCNDSAFGESSVVKQIQFPPFIA